MNKAFFVIALGLTVLLLGCVQQPLGPTTQYVCPDGTVVLEKTLCPAGGTGSAVRELTLEEELSVCSGMPAIQTGSYEDICIIGLAGKHKDTSLCRKVSQDQRASCYALVAELKNDPDTCTEAEFMEDRCYNQYAMDKRDGSVCAKIKDISNKDSCYSNLSNQLGDPAICDKILSAGQKDSCYWNIAQRLGDSSYCNQITNNDQKQNCLQVIGERPPEMIQPDRPK